MLLLLALGLAGLLPLADYLSFLEKRRLVADSLQALWLLSGLAAVGLGACRTVGDELRSGVCGLLVATRLSRTSWLSGKLAGLALLLLPWWLAAAVTQLWGSRLAFDDYRVDWPAARLYWALLLLAVLLATWRAWRGHSFAASLTAAVSLLLPLGLLALGLLPRGAWSGGQLLDWRQLPAVALYYPQWLLGAAVALPLALVGDAVPTLLAGAVVLALGLTADALLSGPVGRSIGWLLPNWQPFQVGDQWVRGGASWGLVQRAWLAGLAQTAALWQLTVAAWAEHELG
ncbi:MAG: hypothetical protein IT204_05920 [Fimbriimonadaceae bacterium]|nr:hypothetical protein [Fimbriimonadaceae bacterium]